MTKFNAWVKEEVEGLRRTRDELGVQASLGAAELRDRWEVLEKRWYELEGRVKAMSGEAKHDADDVRDAAKLLVEELREGYEHLKSRL
jgi:hypothetical protein